jgi:hypothetical protein
MTDTDPTVHRATDEFVAFLLATRSDWVEGEIRRAIGAATGLQRSWRFITNGLEGIAFDGGQPLDLCPVATAQANAGAAAGPNPEYLETKATLLGEHRKAPP